MKALGFKDGEVFALFLAETVIVGAAGCLAGLAFAGAGLAAIQHYLKSRNVLPDFHLDPALRYLFAAVCFGLLVPVLGSLRPITRAARANPAAALRSE